METLEGPLRLKGVAFLVFNHPMKEILLSLPLLVSLGFDLYAHLARVGDQYQDANWSNVSFERLKLATDAKGSLASLCVA